MANPVNRQLGPSAPAAMPTPAAPVSSGADCFAAWLLESSSPPPAPPAQSGDDEWHRLGLHGEALACARAWARDLAEGELPEAPQIARVLAPALRQLLADVRVDPRAFQARADAPDVAPAAALRPRWWERWG